MRVLIIEPCCAHAWPELAAQNQFKMNTFWAEDCIILNCNKGELFPIFRQIQVSESVQPAVWVVKKGAPGINYPEFLSYCSKIFCKMRLSDHWFAMWSCIEKSGRVRSMLTKVGLNSRKWLNIRYTIFSRRLWGINIHSLVYLIAQSSLNRIFNFFFVRNSKQPG